MLDDFTKANLALWDEWVEIHAKSAMYDVEGFLAGASSLDQPAHSIERDELGPDVAGTTLLHLQCHFGLDTLSWARMGATVTGVDFSGKAVEKARSLAAQTDIEATFIQSNVYDLPDVLDGEFDIVFASWGVLIWLSDLARWAQVAAHFLKPGGIFYIVEFHPFVLALDDERVNELRPGYPYFYSAEPETFEASGSYAEPDAETTHNVSHEWQHNLGDVVSALTGAGLTIEYLHEFPFCQNLMGAFLERGDDGWTRVRGMPESVPLSFSLRAVRRT